MPRRLFAALLVWAIAGMLPAAAATGQRDAAELVDAQLQLLDDRDGRQWGVVSFRIASGWHLYWRNPGDSGTAPTLSWRLPAGWSAGELRWPTPRRIPTGPLVNYGYRGQFALLLPLEAPNAMAGATVTVAAAWLVCKVECIPQRRTLSTVYAPSASAAGAETLAALMGRLPAQASGPSVYRLDDPRIELLVDAAGWAPAGDGELWFAAEQWGQVAASAAQQVSRRGAGLLMAMNSGDLPPSGVLRGVLVAEPGGDAPAQGLRVSATPVDALTFARRTDAMDTGPPGGLAGGTEPRVTGDASGGLWWLSLLAAFAGGLILNLMPCVLPVLSIKLIGFVEQGAVRSASRRRALARQALAYVAGVLLSFTLLAVLLLVLRAGGEAVGWGFQLQSPLLVALLAVLMLLVALNLSGVYALGHALMGLGQADAGRRGHGGFMTGVLATLVATPCTAPFMGAALGAAVTLPWPQALSVFLMLGLGFALPVLLLGLFPAWTRWLPRPGAWMERLRGLLAFPMYGAALWLLWVLAQQVDAAALGWHLAGLLAVALAAWSWGQVQRAARSAQRRSGWFGMRGLAVAALVAGIALQWVAGTAPAPHRPAPESALSGERDASAGRWSRQRVAQLRASGRPVLVNFTAAWCITCKVNEAVALSTAEVQAAFERHRVAYLKADWTVNDPAISRELAGYGRSGVPLYLLFDANPDTPPQVLPQLLTPGLVVAALERLGE